MSDGFSPYERPWRFASHILLGTSFALLSTATVNAEEHRECCALPRIIVYQHAVCAAKLDNVMNVDIFPNADITYDSLLSAFMLLSLFYHVLSSLCDDVRQYQIFSVSGDDKNTIAI